MSVPGPPGGLWGLSLVAWALGSAALGEALRGTVARWVPAWSRPEPLERFVLDFYLGGAVLYAVAAVELGAFVAPVVLALPVLGGAVVVYRLWLVRRSSPGSRAAAPHVRPLLEPWGLVALGSAIGLFAIELAAAVPVPTGNTFDSSLLTTYVAVLLHRGSLPLTFEPFASSGLLYPQGTTVWLAWAQLDFGLPPARTALLVTPLFLGLTPLSGFVLGRKLLGSPRAGAAFAVALAWLGPSTRTLVGGSNDLALALPLVLLLGAQLAAWSDRLPSVGDAAGFGLLLGYSATLNVVGAEWLLPAWLVFAVLGRPAFGSRVAAGVGRWALAAVSSLAAGIPSLYVLAQARRAPSSLAGTFGVPSSTPVGINVAQFVGSIDPFLLHVGDVELSPIPFVRAELIGLLIVGVLALIIVQERSAVPSHWTVFSRWAFAAGLAIVGWLALQVAARVPGSPVRDIALLSNSAELSLWLFTVYGLVAAIPLVLAFDRLPGRHPVPATARATVVRGRPLRLPALVPVACAVVIVVPAAVLTPVSLSPFLSTTYGEFGNVSGADFALFDYAAAQFHPDQRVLVAPGSAGEFLPGYSWGIVLLYPMEPGWTRINASYDLVVSELCNGTLDPSALAALASLDVDRIVVTGNNTVLWPALWAAPLLRAQVHGTPTFPVLFHQDDAWVFNASACRPASAGCP